VNAFNTPLTIDELRTQLTGCWNDLLEIEIRKDGFSLALPHVLPDGWQVGFDLLSHFPAGVKLTDRGKTLGALHAQGQSFTNGHTRECLEKVLQDWGIQRDGFELFQWVEGMPDGEALHCFGQALIEMAHLTLLHEPRQKSEDMTDQRMRKIFQDHGVEAKSGAYLNGQARNRIRIDYLVESPAPKAFQLIHRQGRILDVMEVWGWRWTDLRKGNPRLQPAMIYDPYHQEIDQDSRAIGEEVCDLFCSYEETDRIHAFLGGI